MTSDVSSTPLYFVLLGCAYHAQHTSIVLKARHLSGSGLGMPEQALGGIPLSFGIVVEVINFLINLLNFHANSGNVKALCPLS